MMEHGGQKVGGILSEQANSYLKQHFLAEWNARFTHSPANPTDVHRALGKEHDLAASLSHVESRRIGNDYTFQFRAQRYQIDRNSVRVGMKGKKMRVEARLDATVAARYEGHYLEVAVCDPAKAAESRAEPSHKPVRKDHNRGGRSSWMRNFHLNSAQFLSAPELMEHRR